MKRHVQNWLWILPLLLLLMTVAHPHLVFGSDRIDDVMDALGFALVLLGITMRVCARGWKYENGRRGLVTDGLYGYVRHPLYLASFLLGLGLCALLGVGWFAAAYVVCFWAGHLPAIRREETALARRWPALHAAYRERVPALLPRLRPFGRRPIRPHRLRDAIRREADAVCGWTFAGIGLHIWEHLATARRPPQVAIELDTLIVLAFLLAIAWVLLKARKPAGREALDSPGL